MNPPIISVTGTKGKTTTVAIIADVLLALGHNVLKVDTTGHFVNGERRSTLDDSKRTWRLVPSVCPGRYLWEFHANPELTDNGVAVLECSLGSSASSGLGYRYGNVGVFLNVFSDHIGSSKRITSKDDIVKAKDFVFSRLDPNDAMAVFNADDPYVCKALTALPDEIQDDPSVLLPIGLTFGAFDVKNHLSRGGKALTIRGTELMLLSGDQETVLADIANIPWTFGGVFTPSLWNVMSATAALYAYYKGELPEGFREAIEATRLDKYGGRLTLLRAGNGATILADYAHEKESLAAIAQLGRTLVQPGGKLIGVVRMAYDRTEELKFETGAVIGESFDTVVVFEKIDGYWRKPVIKKHARFQQEVGVTSEVVTAGVASVNPNVTRILREDEALAHAASITEPGDAVVVIVNDDIVRSIGFIKDSFKAEFI